MQSAAQQYERLCCSACPFDAGEMNARLSLCRVLYPATTHMSNNVNVNEVEPAIRPTDNNVELALRRQTMRSHLFSVGV